MHMIDVTPRQLRMARAAAGWTQDELAERSGISRVTIANLEAGKISDPRTQTVRLLVRALAEAGVAMTAHGVEVEGKPLENQIRRNLR
jgi:predicted transcriptional regulator